MNFVCIVFELGDKMLTLSSMENIIVQCNLQCLCFLHMQKAGFPMMHLCKTGVIFTTVLFGGFFQIKICGFLF